MKRSENLAVDRKGWKGLWIRSFPVGNNDEEEEGDDECSRGTKKNIDIYVLELGNYVHACLMKVINPNSLIIIFFYSVTEGLVSSLSAFYL